MKHIKKLFALAIIAAVCAAFTMGLIACNNDDNKPSVVMIAYDSEIMDGSFNQLCWEGLSVCKGVKASNTAFKSSDGKTFDAFLDEVIETNPAAIFLMDERVKDEIIQKANTNKGIIFGILDSSEQDRELPENVFTCNFKVEQSSFLAGYVAAKEAQAAGVNKIGFIGGMDIDVINTLYYGYEAGAEYAVSDIEIIKNYIGSYTDKESGKRIALDMFNGGCEVIFQAAGEAGLGVIEAVSELDGLVIGVDSDQSALAPGKVLTSVIKNVGGAAEKMGYKLFNGEKIGGQCFTFDLENGGVGIVESSLSDARKNDVSALTAKIKSGEIIVPSAAR